jgi:hypothetical protein
MENAAMGFGALGFWLFIAACVIGGIWDAARKRESQQETLRRLVESDREINAEVIQQVLNAGGGGDNTARDLKVAGYIVISLSPGLAVLGLFIAQLNEKALMPLLGVACLMGLLGAGMLFAAKVAAGDEGKHKAR